ncbi:Elongation factor P--(R)-beta-lysine ligase [Planctomycetes bacterium Pan216]|uniref:Elongation factor P--(R)-beta-lysine ligase n=1 Tax=Kolteria novifilia TaxID=2527975 RepID=A0A518BCG8_9BACT|nr:Elongation factor P--(R)-beta-lysine ligase [Planctomycetes bacterium Pan216]
MSLSQPDSSPTDLSRGRSSAPGSDRESVSHRSPELALPSANVDNLKRRAALLARTRRFFEERRYFEVETPVLSRDVCVDVYLDPIAVEGASGERHFLQTSPEFAMKRLLAAGAGSIYQITRAFRDREFGPLHNPEFTIVEWYRVDADANLLMEEISDLAQALLGTAPAERWSYREAFRRTLDLDPFTAGNAQLAEVAQSAGFHDREAERDDLLDFLLATRVQPELAKHDAILLHGYPPSQAALAEVATEGDVTTALRFELFVRGIELCNGYQELRDANELTRRQNEQNEKRIGQKKASLPTDSRLLRAMEIGLPRCSGCALGFDRLAMLALGATSIQEVVAFPADRA